MLLLPSLRKARALVPIHPASAHRQATAASSRCETPRNAAIERQACRTRYAPSRAGSLRLRAAICIIQSVQRWLFLAVTHALAGRSLDNRAARQASNQRSPLGRRAIGAAPGRIVCRDLESRSSAPVYRTALLDYRPRVDPDGNGCREPRRALRSNQAPASAKLDGHSTPAGDHRLYHRRTTTARPGLVSLKTSCDCG